MAGSNGRFLEKREWFLCQTSSELGQVSTKVFCLQSENLCNNEINICTRHDRLGSTCLVVRNPCGAILTFCLLGSWKFGLLKSHKPVITFKVHFHFSKFGNFDQSEFEFQKRMFSLVLTPLPYQEGKLWSYFFRYYTIIITSVSWKQSAIRSISMPQLIERVGKQTQDEKVNY